jgi:hypothetical protein
MHMEEQTSQGFLVMEIQCIFLVFVFTTKVKCLVFFFLAFKKVVAMKVLDLQASCMSFTLLS